MRSSLLVCALVLLPGLAVAAKGVVSLDRVGVTQPAGQNGNSSRVYRPTAGGPTYQIRVPKGRVIRDARFDFVTPTSSTRRSDVYTLSPGLFMNLGSKAWSEVEHGEIFAIKPR